MYVWWVWLCEVEYRLECEVECRLEPLHVRWVVCVLHIFHAMAWLIFRFYPLFLWVKMENEKKL